MDDRELQDTMLPKLVRLHDEPLDPNTVAAYVDGRLSDEEHADVEARIARDPDALLLVNALRDDRRVVTPIRLLAMAAVVLIAVGVAWFIREDDDVVPASLGERMVAAVADLQQHEPDLLRGFALFGASELRRAPAITRGGGAWIAPQGVLLTAPAALRWRNPPGTSRVRIELLGPGFRWSSEVAGESVDAPALEPGRYVVTLRALDALAGQRIRRVFEVADATMRDRHERAMAAIRAHAPGDLEALLVAQYALHARLHVQARGALSEGSAAEGEVASEAHALSAHLDALEGR